MNLEITDAILFQFCAGTTTPQQNQQIAAWIEQLPDERQKQLDKAHGMYLLSVICQPEESTKVSLKQKPGRIASIYKYAAGVAAALLIGIAASHSFYTHHIDQLTSQLTTIEAPNGQRIRLTLGDGSIIDLNSGSKIVYPSIFASSERRVKLYGEAMFDVQHDQYRPFIVQTYACDVEVLGTRFNVIADESMELFSTALLHGSVAVRDRRTNERIHMTENNLVRLENGHLHMSQIANQDDYLWTEGVISASGIGFDKLIDKLEKGYNVKIRMDRKQLPVVNFQRCKIRISDGIDHAMRLLQRASDFTYRHDESGDVIIIE